MSIDYNSEFSRRYDPREEKCLLAPHRIVYEKNLSGNARIILIALLGLPEGWKIRHCSFLPEINLKKDAFKNAMDMLIKFGYVTRVLKRIKGKFTAYDYEFCSFPIFKKDGENDPKTTIKKPKEIKEKVKKETQKPNKLRELRPMRKTRNGLKVVLNHFGFTAVVNPQQTEKTESSNISLFKNRDTENTEKHAREEISEVSAFPVFSDSSFEEKKERQVFLKDGTIDWTPNLTSEEKKFHDDVINFQPPTGPKIESSFITGELKKHPLEKVKQAFEYCKYAIENGTKIKKSFGGFMRTALQNEWKAPSERMKKEKEKALTSQKLIPEHIKVFKNHIKWPLTGDELSFGVGTEDEWLRTAKKNTERSLEKRKTG